MKQISVKFNDEELKILEQLKNIFFLKDSFGAESQTIKKSLFIAVAYMDKVSPHFQDYETLFVDEEHKRFKDDLYNQKSHKRDFLE